MTCVICRYGETTPGVTTVILHCDDVKILVGGVPAAICTSCGEYYLDEPVASRVYELAATLPRHELSWST